MFKNTAWLLIAALFIIAINLIVMAFIGIELSEYKFYLLGGIVVSLGAMAGVKWPF